MQEFRFPTQRSKLNGPPVITKTVSSHPTGQKCPCSSIGED